MINSLKEPTSQGDSRGWLLVYLGIDGGEGVKSCLLMAWWPGGARVTEDKRIFTAMEDDSVDAQKGE